MEILSSKKISSYGPDPTRPYEILAGSEAGAYSIAVGEAVWKSTKSGLPIDIEQLLQHNYEEIKG